MPCAVNLTQSSLPKWMTNRLSMHPTSPIKTLERKLVDIFSSPMSELTLAAPIPLPAPLFGEHAQLPVIKGVVTNLNFQKGFARIVLHDSTKNALSLTYLHFLRTWPMRWVHPSMKQNFQTRFKDMVNTIQIELPCDSIQCAIPTGRGDLPLYYQGRLPHDGELEETLASIVWRVRSLFFVGISTDIPWSTIWDIPFTVPQNEIKEYSQNWMGSNREVKTKQKKGDRKKMKKSDRPSHRKTKPAPITPNQSEDTIVIASYHPMATRRKSNHHPSPTPSTTRRLNRFRPANVSQNARGGKIRYPSVSHDSTSSPAGAQDNLPNEGKYLGCLLLFLAFHMN